MLPEPHWHELGDELDEGHVGAPGLAPADLLAQIGVRARHLRVKLALPFYFFIC